MDRLKFHRRHRRAGTAIRPGSPVRRLTIMLLGLLFLLPKPVAADSVVGMYQMFSSFNVYSPSVLLDGSVYKMWYGGWQSSGQTNDYIYYRTSSDNTNWSGYTTVLTTQEFANQITGCCPGSVINHVNDPSVTKIYNSVTGQYQYTMFFTVQVGNTNPPNQNQIWSEVSSDGINWSNPIQLVTTGAFGGGLPNSPFGPTSIVQQSGSQVWRVYFGDSGCHNIWSIGVNGNRQMIAGSNQVAYSNSSLCISDPDVDYFNSTWHLFFNVHGASGPNFDDIYEAKSSVNTSWSTSSPLIVNSGNPVCATTTPASLFVSGSEYDLYFGQVSSRNSDGSCNLAANTSIQRWLWTGG